MIRLPAAALALLLLTAGAAHAQTMNSAQPDQSHASAANSAKHAGTVVVDKTKEAAHATGKAAKKAGHATVAVVKKVGHATASGAKTVGHATAKGAKTVGHAVRDTAHEAKDKVSGSSTSK